MSPLVHLDDDIDEIEAPRERILKPVTETPRQLIDVANPKERVVREVLGNDYINTARGAADNEHDHAVTAAYERLEKAIEDKKSVSTITRLQTKLAEARQAASAAEEQRYERLDIARKLDQKKAREVSVEKQKAIAIARADARASDLVVMTITYNGVTLTASPSKSPDQTIRATVVEGFRQCATLMLAAAEHDVASAGVIAGGGQPSPNWSRTGLVTRCSDLARVGIRERAITIESTDAS